MSRAKTGHTPLRVMVGVMCLLGLGLSACSGGSSSTDAQATQFCDQLASGTAPFDVFQSMREEFPHQPDWAAAAKSWAKSSCPEQLENNEELRNIISNTGGDPDSEQ